MCDAATLGRKHACIPASGHTSVAHISRHNHTHNAKTPVCSHIDGNCSLQQQAKMQPLRLAALNHATGVRRQRHMHLPTGASDHRGDCVPCRKSITRWKQYVQHQSHLNMLQVFDHLAATPSGCYIKLQLSMQLLLLVALKNTDNTASREAINTPLLHKCRESPSLYSPRNTKELQCILLYLLSCSASLPVHTLHPKPATNRSLCFHQHICSHCMQAWMINTMHILAYNSLAIACMQAWSNTSAVSSHADYYKRTAHALVGCSQSCAASAAGRSHHGNRSTAQPAFATRQATALTSGKLCDSVHCTAHVNMRTAEYCPCCWAR
jgi:hypothetical protein